MKRLFFTFVISLFIFPSMAKADLIYFLGKKPSLSTHLLSYDTVDRTYTIVVKGLHANGNGDVLSSVSAPIFDAKTRNVHYIFSAQENPEAEQIQYLRSVNIDTKVVTDKEFGISAGNGSGYVPQAPLFQIVR